VLQIIIHYVISWGLHHYFLSEAQTEQYGRVLIVVLSEAWCAVSYMVLYIVQIVFTRELHHIAQALILTVVASELRFLACRASAMSMAVLDPNSARSST
jgi:hypothetical protein